MFWESHSIHCGGLTHGGNVETGMDDYTGMRTVEEKDGKSHFQLEEKGEKKKDDLRI